MSAFQCNPALHRRDGQTCLPSGALHRLRKTWNKTHPRHKIQVDKTRKNGKQDAGKTNDIQLWNELKSAMSTHYKCDTEYCMVKKLPGLPESEKKGLLGFFRTEKPTEWDKKPTEWLDSDNIEQVMNQYEAANKNFSFIGPVPIDFDAKEPSSGAWGQCIINELCNLNLKDCLKKGKTQTGIIFNLDKHDEPGSHWVCAFIDLDKSAAYYFDSYGYEPPAEIVTLLKRCKDQGCKNIYYNDIRHQRKGSECGMYCLFVLICLLNGKDFLKICKDVIDDDTMNSFRNVIFAEEKVSQATLEKAKKTLCL